MARITNFRVTKCKQGQLGAAAIEFALVFMLFFLLFYAIVSYGFIFFLQNAFIHAAEEGARAAIAVDPLTQTDYPAKVQSQVRQTVGNALNWLPEKAKNKALGEGNSNVQAEIEDGVLTVTVLYANYRSDPLVPVLNFPGTWPIIPEKLQGQAVLSLP